MNIKLSQAIILMSVLKNKVLELKNEMGKIHSIYVQKRDQYEMPERTFDDVVKELREVQQDLIDLEVKIAQANNREIIIWNDKKISILKAINLAKTYRDQLQMFSHYGSLINNEIDRMSRTQSGASLVRVLTYDPKYYRQEAEKLIRRANKLSSLVDEANVVTIINFPNYSKYMD